MAQGPITLEQAGKTLGPMLLGSYFSCILYGIFIVQAYIYFQQYKKDSAWYRYFVLYLIVIQTVSAVMTCGIAWEPLIFNYGNLKSMERTPKLLAADAILTVFISTPVQLFFAWRIRATTRSFVSTGLILFFALASLAAGITTTVSTVIFPEYRRFAEFRPAVITWLMSAALADICITVSLVLFLRSNKAGFPLTDTLLNKIILLTIQTGAVTSIAAILDVAVFMGLKETTLVFIWDFSIARLYAICFLSTLNARAGWNKLIDSERRKTMITFINMEQLHTPLALPSHTWQK